MKKLIKDIEILFENEYRDCYVKVTVYEGFEYHLQLKYNDDYLSFKDGKTPQISKGSNEETKMLKSFVISSLMKNSIKEIIKFNLKDLNPKIDTN